MMIPLIEYARKHGIDPGNARRKAAKGGFLSAQKVGRDWIIDEQEPVIDGRYKTGQYVGRRNKQAHNGTSS